MGAGAEGVGLAGVGDCGSGRGWGPFVFFKQGGGLVFWGALLVGAGLDAGVCPYHQVYFRGLNEPTQACIKCRCDVKLYDSHFPVRDYDAKSSLPLMFGYLDTTTYESLNLKIRLDKKSYLPDWSSHQKIIPILEDFHYSSIILHYLFLGPNLLSLAPPLRQVKANMVETHCL
jgi:hypothetical protein